MVAAPVVLPPRVRIPGLNDSKKLNAARREELAPTRRRPWPGPWPPAAPPRWTRSTSCAPPSWPPHRAIAALATRPELLSIDGNRFAPSPGSALLPGEGRRPFPQHRRGLHPGQDHRDELMAGLHERPGVPTGR